MGDLVGDRPACTGRAETPLLRGELGNDAVEHFLLGLQIARHLAYVRHRAPVLLPFRVGLRRPPRIRSTTASAASLGEERRVGRTSGRAKSRPSPAMTCATAAVSTSAMSPRSTA